MIKQVSIQNFKSILDLSFPAKRVNVFIGEPNSGKSNILEALSFFTIGEQLNLPTIIRYESIQNLFFDNDTHKIISVKADSDSIEFSIQKGDGNIKLETDHDKYEFLIDINENTIGRSAVGFSSKYAKDYNILGKFGQYKPYYFRPFIPQFNEEGYDIESLSSPNGNNLFEVVQTNKQLREIIAGIFLEKGYKLNLNASRREINFSKEKEGVLYTYPYQLLSDTLQRTIFYTAILESNQDSVIILEEPEAKMFPYFTSHLAESIAIDSDNNQFFIVTHNPYFLSAIIGKTPIDDISVNIVYSRDYQTRVEQLSREELSEVLDLSSGVFFNLDKFLPE